MPEQKLFSHFEKISKKDWFQKMESDLKGKSIDDINWDFDQDWKVPPAFHLEDIENPVTSINGNESKLSWNIQERFLIGDEEKVNSCILESLAGGCTSIVLDCTEKPLADWNKVLRGVFPEMIKLQIETKNLSDLKTVGKRFAHFTEQRNADKSFQNIRYTFEVDHDITDEAISSLHFKPAFNFRLSLASIQKLGLVDSISSFFQQILTIQNMVDAEMDEIILIIEADQSYIREIIKLRAIRLIWENILAAHDLPFNSSSFWSQITSAHYNQNTNQNKIKASSMAVSALTGGCGTLEILPSNGVWSNEDQFHRRIARNIHHLLQYESRFHKATDPVKGSYFFEKMTKDLVTKVWEKLVI